MSRSGGYVNIFTDAGWIVYNLFVGVNGQSQVSEYFSLGLAQPTDMKQLSAYVIPDSMTDNEVFSS